MQNATAPSTFYILRLYDLHLFPFKTSEVWKIVAASANLLEIRHRRGRSSGRARGHHNIDDERPGLVSPVSGSRWSASSPRTLTPCAHPNTHRFSPFPTTPDASVGNASSPPGPFSQALARALVPHLSDTSGTMRHPYSRRRRRRFYESLGTRQLLVLLCLLKRVLYLVNYW